MFSVISIAALALSCSTTHAIQLAINKNFGDPSVITVDNKWYAFASGSSGARIPGATSPDFDTWTVTPNGSLDHDYLASTPAWSYAPQSDVAAPDINQLVSLPFSLKETVYTF